MNRFLRIGHAFSRDCFLIFGGAMLLSGIASAAINVLQIIKYHDWPSSAAEQIFYSAAVLAICGAAFLIGAYGLFSWERLGPYLIAVVSGAQIGMMVASWSAETPKLKGMATILTVYDLPILLTLVWAVAQIAQGFKARKPVETT